MRYSDYKTRGALKVQSYVVVVSVSDLPANPVLKLRKSSLRDRTSGRSIKRANRSKAVTSRRACASLLAHVFRMASAGAKATKLVCLEQKARNIVCQILGVRNF